MSVNKQGLPMPAHLFQFLPGEPLQLMYAWSLWYSFPPPFPLQAGNGGAFGLVGEGHP